MLTEPHFTNDISARLDLLLSQYLQAKRVELHPLACPPWRNHGRQTMERDYASCNNVDNGRRASMESPGSSFDTRHFD
jgi:hypothetical protein